jgi:hypothetical protein
MKRGGLARALQARKSLDENPERESARQTRARADRPSSPAPPTKPEPTPAAKTRRFHTTVYPDSKEFYDDIRVALIREGRGRDFNRLVNDLLAEWLDAHGD